MSDSPSDDDLGPQDAPLGATPTLPAPPPSPATKRAADMFARFIAGDDEAPTRVTPAPTRPGFGGGRRYDLALQAAGMTSAPVAVDAPALAAPLTRRPPVGAPTVRPSPHRRDAVDTVPQELLEATADNVMLVSDADGATSFEISIRDEVFADLTCRIEVKEGRIVAVFRAPDADTRRLLTAESGRLRVQLEERGLRVEEVRVEG